ncbi:MAG: cupin domain-containing protein [Pseudomonadota bacterium]
MSDAAAKIIEHFEMEYLEGESGYLVQRPRSEFVRDFDGQPIAIHNSIYYLLTDAHPTNYLHYLESEDIHILVDGGPLDYYLFLENGDVRHVRLGRDFEAGETFAVTVPARSYKAIRLAPGASHGLMVNVLTPSWTEDRVKIGVEDSFYKTYAGKAAWATDAFLKELAPPAASD